MTNKRHKANTKARQTAQDFVSDHILRLRLQRMLEDAGIAIEEFGPWDKNGTITHSLTSITLRQSDGQQEVNLLKEESLKKSSKIGA